MFNLLCTVNSTRGIVTADRTVAKLHFQSVKSVRKTREHTRRRTKQARRDAPKPSPPADILILSLSRAAAYRPSGREICISITDPQSEPAELSAQFAEVLRVAFSDIVEPTGLPSHQLFAAEHATAIVEFLDRWPEVDRIVVHCVAGLSRSPGVALAIAELRGWPTSDLERQFPLWNSWVRQQLVSAGRAAGSRVRRPR